MGFLDWRDPAYLIIIPGNNSPWAIIAGGGIILRPAPKNATLSMRS